MYHQFFTQSEFNENLLFVITPFYIIIIITALLCFIYITEQYSDKTTRIIT